MTTVNLPNAKTVQVTVTEASQEQTRDGEVQWALRLECKDMSQYPMPVTMPVEWADKVLKGSVHTVTLARGRQKMADKGGGDGSRLYNYWWNLQEWDTEAPLTPPAPAAAPSGGSQDEWRRSKNEMRWTEAINNATNILAGQPDAPGSRLDFQALILDWAAWYYAAIVAGPPTQDAPSGATEAAQPPQAPEPPRTPATLPTAAQGRATVVQQHQESLARQTPDPQAMVAASAKQWNDDIRTGARSGKLLSERFIQDWMYAKLAWTWKSLTPEQAVTVASAIANGEVK